MNFHLSLMKKRSQYSPTLRRTFPRVNVAFTPRISDAVITKYAVIIVKTANMQGHKLNLSTGKAMAHYAIEARKGGMTYAEAVLYAISKYS